MTLLADLLTTVFERRIGFIGPSGTDTRTTDDLVKALVEATGEESGRTIAVQILDRYDAFDDAEKNIFFKHLCAQLDINPTRVTTALSAYVARPEKATYSAYMNAVEPQRQEFIRRLNMVPGATERLVRMRADLLRLSKGDPALGALDLDFKHLFSSWFNRGFLVLRPINWQSPAHILEKIIAYEAVHAIDSWDDLRRRLEPSDRRCFAFFHPAMPNEPLIFVEVALTKGIVGSVQSLLSEERVAIPSAAADTAIFYSISNCQTGLARISFGNSLIKQVAADLSFELPSLKTFVTLSPIPGLMDWLRSHAPRTDPTDHKLLLSLAAHYLIAAKYEDGLPLDPVARFHLGNGALVYKVHALAESSQKGRLQSNGVMVNYLYDLPKVSLNHEKFATSQEIVTSSEIRTLNAAAEKIQLQETN